MGAMWTRLALVIMAASAGAGDAARASAGPDHRTELFARGPHRGMSYAHEVRGGRGYGSADSERALRRLAALGVEWVAVTPFGFQRDARAPGFRYFRSGSRGPGETDE